METREVRISVFCTVQNVIGKRKANREDENRPRTNCKTGWTWCPLWTYGQQIIMTFLMLSDMHMPCFSTWKWKQMRNITTWHHILTISIILLHKIKCSFTRSLPKVLGFFNSDLIILYLLSSFLLQSSVSNVQAKSHHICSINVSNTK
jgi:hypothetical protein